jgi:hypothetical protein
MARLKIGFFKVIWVKVLRNFKFSYFFCKFYSTIFGPKYSHRGGQQKLGKFAKEKVNSILKLGRWV